MNKRFSIFLLIFMLFSCGKESVDYVGIENFGNNQKEYLRDKLVKQCMAALGKNNVDRIKARLIDASGFNNFNHLKFTQTMTKMKKNSEGQFETYETDIFEGRYELIHHENNFSVIKLYDAEDDDNPVANKYIVVSKELNLAGLNSAIESLCYDPNSNKEIAESSDDILGVFDVFSYNLVDNKDKESVQAKFYIDLPFYFYLNTAEITEEKSDRKTTKKNRLVSVVDTKTKCSVLSSLDKNDLCILKSMQIPRSNDFCDDPDSLSEQNGQLVVGDVLNALKNTDNCSN